MKCVKCGKELESVEVDFLRCDGAGDHVEFLIEEFDDGEGNTGAVFFTDEQWCGYNMDENKRFTTIRCPHCEQFPFDSKEVKACNTVKVICFNKRESEEKQEA